MHDSQATRSLWPILFAAFAIKAIALFVVLPLVSTYLASGYGLGFADEYDLIANNLALGNGYRVSSYMDPTMMREPGYPLFLAALFKIGGYHIEVARLANLVLAFGIALLMIRLVRKTLDDSVVGLVATLLFLFHPGTLIAEARGGVEMLFILLLLVFILAVLEAIDRGKAGRFFAAGLLLGLVVVVRSTPMFFPVFLLGFLIVTAGSFQERIGSFGKIALVLIGMAIVMTPWVVRNYQLVGRVVPTASVQGVAAQEGQFTCRRLSFAKGFQELQNEAAAERDTLAAELGRRFEGGYYQHFFASADELAFNAKLLDRTSEGYRNDPLLFVKCASQNALNFWILGKNWKATGLNVLIQVPLLILAGYGAFLLWRQGSFRRVAVLALFVAYIMAVHIPIIAHTRHSIPTMPFLSVFAAVALVSMWRARRAGVSGGAPHAGA